jgi:hypothetical protein
VLVVSLSLSASSVFAAPQVFFAHDNPAESRVESDAKFSHFTAGLFDFGVYTAEADSPFTPNPSIGFPGTSITADTENVIVMQAPGFSIDGQALLELEFTGAPQGNTTFDFNQPITAFGLYAIEGGDSGNDNPTTFRLTDTTANTFVDVLIQVGPDWETGNIFFLGIADTVPFDRVTIIETGDLADGMLYDNIVAGFVPEPNSCALMALAGVGMFRMARRRNRG